jgi:integral membrane sensor domain MASE1
MINETKQASLIATKSLECIAGLVLGGTAWFLRDVLFGASQGLLLDPIVGVVVGLAWRNWILGACIASVFPFLGSATNGFAEVGGLWMCGFITIALLRSVGEGGGIGLRGMLLLPLATGVTLAGILFTQMLGGVVPFSSGFGTRWAQEALGVMAITPLVAKIGLDFLSQLNRRLFVAWVLLTALLMAVGSVASDPSLDPGTALALELLPVVILFWQAMRFGCVGATTSCFLLAILSGLAWSSGNRLLLDFPEGIFSTILAAVFGTAHGIGALRDERLETHMWTSQAAQAYQVVFWRWQKGKGVDWDDPERAASVGLERMGLGWRLCQGWSTDEKLPHPATLVGSNAIKVDHPKMPSRWLEFSGLVHTEDSDGDATTLLGVIVDVTSSRVAQEQKAKTLRREGELRAIRAQLQPHVVFNALNRIASLAMSEPESARDLIVRLSRLLRASLMAGEKDSVALSEEVSLIHDCVALEGAGYGKRLRFHNEIPSDIEEKGLPPLALLSLVNGAIRRGVGMRKEGASIVLSMPQRGVFRVTVTPPVSTTEESEFAPWPEPLWVERLLVETKRRARIEVERHGEAVISADLVMEKGIS